MMMFLRRRNSAAKAAEAKTPDTPSPADANASAQIESSPEKDPLLPLVPPVQTLSRAEANSRSMLALAHVGDAVYELLVRGSLIAGSTAGVNELHRHTVSRVRAESQAEAARLLQPKLTEEEKEIYRRGRNCRVHGVPAHASPGDYHAATGLEALFGWLYLIGETARIEELFRSIQEESHGPVS